MLASLRRAVAWQIYVRCHMVYPLAVPRRLKWIPARYDSIYFEALAQIADDDGCGDAAEYRRIAAELREREAAP